jgi:L-alanine-DL-glutamate epimerase-like enolase superfamily enzyme
MITDVRPVASELYFLPVQTRVPLKFGSETLTSVICARVKITVESRDGKRADGWGETPLSVQWVWPSELPYEARLNALKQLCVELNREWARFEFWGHPLEIGQAFQSTFLKDVLPRMNADDTDECKSGLSDPCHPRQSAANFPLSKIPVLARLVCCSPCDIALHDAYGNLHGVDIYDTYSSDWLSQDLASFFDDPSFAGKFPDAYLQPRQDQLIAWHLVGGLDPLTADDLRGDEPDDGYPILLSDWIRRDGLKALKIKLRGTDRAWDLDRLIRVGRIAIDHDVLSLSADFNCTVTDPLYVAEVLDALKSDHPRIFDRLLYVEQPFPYDLENHRIDVHDLVRRKPLFLDESAHDWRMIRLGKSLGWNGVALKTCKTQSGAILSLCWARAHGMQLMVQDLTNPMLAMIPHALLAAHAGTIMGVETNACQFYPGASAPERAVHPGLFQRRDGRIDLSSLVGTGFGYRMDEIERTLPPPTARD